MQRRDVLKMSMLMLGTAVSASVSRAVLAGAAGSSGSSGAVFFETQQAAVSLLSEMIIPTTDTPGAIAAGVPDFIGTIVSDWFTDKERQIFFDGLVALDAYCQQAENKPFHLASDETQVAALQDQEAKAANYKGPQAMLAKPPEDENAPFFKKLKELVVLGYYTSEVGSTQELAYRPVPGEYNGDFEFAKVGRQWSH